MFHRKRNLSNSAQHGSNLNSPSQGVIRHPCTINSGMRGNTLDKGYLPIMDDRGQFPAEVATDIYPITAHLHQPGCPQLLHESQTYTDGETITRTPIRVDLHKMEPVYAFHTTNRHMYESTCVPFSTISYVIHTRDSDT